MPKFLYPKNKEFLDRTALYPVHPVEIWTNIYVQVTDTRRKPSLIGVLQALIILVVFGGPVGWVAFISLQSAIVVLNGKAPGGIPSAVPLLVVFGLCLLVLYALVRLAIQSAIAPKTDEIVKLSEALVADYQQTTGTVTGIRAVGRSGKEKILTYTYQDDQQRDLTRTFKTESLADIREGNTVIVIYQGAFSALL